VESSALRYTRTAIALHWLMAVMILASLGMGLYMVDLAISPQKLKYYSWHKWAGVTIFVLAAIRLLWRLSHAAPAMPAMPRWQVLAAHVTHFLLYVAFFAAPLTGWLFSSAKQYI
jgi:cytochrome b561